MSTWRQPGEAVCWAGAVCAIAAAVLAVAARLNGGLPGGGWLLIFLALCWCEVAADGLRMFRQQPALRHLPWFPALGAAQLAWFATRSSAPAAWWLAWLWGAAAALMAGGFVTAALRRLVEALLHRARHETRGVPCP